MAESLQVEKKGRKVSCATLDGISASDYYIMMMMLLMMIMVIMNCVWKHSRV